ncbi:hypothetical protein TEA_026097 [Camellia sinensis var. sinensis]|uniref:Uncharacterized protein n=1 Tax=Camellia sinensis var. sinensis TaxID=542762 RepID=A0A4S4D3T6_CAMSN|nr:hypothetical protein TEA_026097 [Camellia sinensis var. sinensis]
MNSSRSQRVISSKVLKSGCGRRNGGGGAVAVAGCKGRSVTVAAVTIVTAPLRPLVPLRRRYGAVTTAIATAMADTPVNLNHTAKAAVTGGAPLSLSLSLDSSFVLCYIDLKLWEIAKREEGLVSIPEEVISGEVVLDFSDRFESDFDFEVLSLDFEASPQEVLKLGNSTRINEQCLELQKYIKDDVSKMKEFSPDGRFIISADRDFKIRVTLFPKKTLDGAHEIQSFCLGLHKLSLLNMEGCPVTAASFDSLAGSLLPFLLL